MRILFVVPWDQQFGGIASVVGNLAKYLQAEGHDVMFLYPGEANVLNKRKTKWGFLGFELNMRVVFHFNRPLRSALAFLFFFPFTLYQLIRLIRTYQIQIINIHYPMDCFVYFAFCRMILPIKLVTSVHGADLFPDARPKPRYSLTAKFLFFSSDVVITPSAGFLKDVIALFPTLQGKAAFIHNSINLDELNQPAVVESPSDIKKHVLCIAGHKESKGLDVLIHAFASLRHQFQEVKLVLVGDGILRKQLEGLAKELCIHTSIVFLGWRARDEIAKLLQDCDIFVLPSRSESFGIVLLEAMACRKPIIATNVGGIPEIIQDGWNGLLVEPENTYQLFRALNYLLTHPDVAEEIAKNGFETVRKHFTLKEFGSRYEEVFKMLLRGEPWPKHC